MKKHFTMQCKRGRYQVILNSTGECLCTTKSWVKARAIIKNLEKQIPKQLDEGSCPGCKLNMDSPHWLEYCWNCGQKLDWEENI